MLELIRQLFAIRGQGPDVFGEGLPILRAILHSEALSKIVEATGTPVDDLVLQVIRTLVPKES